MRNMIVLLLVTIVAPLVPVTNGIWFKSGWARGRIGIPARRFLSNVDGFVFTWYPFGREDKHFSMLISDS